MAGELTGYFMMTANRNESLWWRIALRFGLGLVFMFSMIQSVTVSVVWWRDELAETGVWEWFWVGSLPILIIVYLRYFSVLRPDCTPCQAPPYVGRAPEDRI